MLFRIEAAMQLGLAIRMHHPGVMPRGNVVGFQLFAVGPEFAELEPIVANNAGIGCSPGKVFVGEVIDDAAEVALEVESVKRNVEQVGHPAGVAGVDGAAAALLVPGAIPFFPLLPPAPEPPDPLLPPSLKH